MMQGQTRKIHTPSYDVLPENQRRLMLMIWDGYAQFERITTRLHYIHLHMPNARVVEALRWLLANKLTGGRFVDFAEGECKGSNLELIRVLTMRIEKDKKERKLYAGKDILV